MLIAAHGPHDDCVWLNALTGRLEQINAQALWWCLLMRTQELSLFALKVLAMWAEQESPTVLTFHSVLCDLDLVVPATFCGRRLSARRSPTGFWRGTIL